MRFARLAASAPDEALRFGRRLLVAMLAIGLTVGALAMLAAPQIVGYVFHREEPLAVALVLLLALSVPLQAVAALFGQQSLIAFGLERHYALVQTAATLLFCALLALLPAWVGGSAYGWALLGADLLVLLLSGTVLACCRPGRAR